MGKEIGGEITQPDKKLYPQTKPTWPSFPPTFLPPFLRVQPDVTTLMKVYLNSLEKHSTEWLLSCSRVPLCWSTAHKSQERCGFNRTNLSASFIWWKKGGCADRWLRTVERGLPQLQPVFGFFICTSYIFPFKACQKGHETEHLVLKNQWRLVTIWSFHISIKIIKHIFLVPVFSHLLC